MDVAVAVAAVAADVVENGFKHTTTAGSVVGSLASREREKGGCVT
jgi:hypothetical protein